MCRLAVVAILLISFLRSRAQPALKIENKYPSLLWEITGKGLKKSSFLFGTMHVSNKMAFNLSDSFYMALHQSDLVALETNPESWQEDMLEFSEAHDPGGSYGAIGYRNVPAGFLNVSTLKFHSYEKRVAAALASAPSTINNLLYRANSERNLDFEEDTYLDLYIYQAGKKWRKKVIGVERYAESLKLAMEAYADAARDKGRKEKSFDPEENYSYAKLQEAYRTGNLDLLDTIGRINSLSPAFDEKFLYRRNAIQAASIDSILRTNASLFAGVGAAHLPGSRGVIEILRQFGYTLRPVKMAGRSSRYKEALELIRVKQPSVSQVSPDGFYSVDVPGRLQNVNPTGNGLQQVQFADMANGSYYTITRVQTNAAAWGHSTDQVVRRIDSLLYENIPGKIISKRVIRKNGYNGFSIVNKTRRGDYQCYQLFITPFEVIIFKMSGSGDYLKDSVQSQRFFTSIRLKEYSAGWKKITSPFGGFEVEMPHDPHILKTKDWQFSAHDKATAIDFSVIRTDVHQYRFTEQDSIDLCLLEESFTGSDFFHETLSRHHTQYKEHAALEGRYRLRDGSIARVRYLVRGPHYYTLLAIGKTEHPQMERFINSFTLAPFQYAPPRKHSDSSLHFTVSTPYFPAPKKDFGWPSGMSPFGGTEQEESEKSMYKDLLIAHDSTGEKIYVSFHHLSRYYQAKDSSQLLKLNGFPGIDSDWIIKKKSEMLLPSGMKVAELVLGDPLSSRALWTKIFYRGSVNFTIRTAIDSVEGPGAFQKFFFETFLPADTAEGIDPMTKKSPVYFSDLFSADSALSRRALNSIGSVKLDATDLPLIKKAILSLNWDAPSYLATKKEFIYKLGTMDDPATSRYLKELFYKAGDTIELQYAVLKSLLTQENRFSYGVFRDILLNDPPVLNTNASFESGEEQPEPDLFFDALYDSLSLTASIIKDLLPLMVVDDYKYPLLKLAGALADKQLMGPAAYENYIPKFLLEAKQSWKKQLISERRRSINEAEKERQAKESGAYKTFRWDNSNIPGEGSNELLELYSILLMPFWNKNVAVPALLRQFLSSSDKHLQYKTALLFLRHQQPLPDSLLPFFAASDEYRYRLYKDLEEMDKTNLFPAAFAGDTAWARSKLVNHSLYNEPDTLVFLQTLPIDEGPGAGSVYFFKYKRKKDDHYWKIASSGPVWKDGTHPGATRIEKMDMDLTGFSDTRLNEEERVDKQLRNKMRRLLLSQTKGGKLFYTPDDENQLDSGLEEPSR